LRREIEFEGELLQRLLSSPRTGYVNHLPRSNYAKFSEAIRHDR
jgi:hypothetical protein